MDIVQTTSSFITEQTRKLLVGKHARIGKMLMIGILKHMDDIHLFLRKEETIVVRKGTLGPFIVGTLTTASIMRNNANMIVSLCHKIVTQ